MQYPSSQNSLKNICSIILKRCYRLVLEKKIKKNKNGNKEIETKNRIKLRIFSEGRRQDFFVKGEVPQKSFFNLAENCDASSVWVGRHRYTRFLQVCDYLKRYGQNTEIFRNSTIV